MEKKKKMHIEKENGDIIMVAINVKTGIEIEREDLPVSPMIMYLKR